MSNLQNAPFYQDITENEIRAKELYYLLSLANEKVDKTSG